MKKQIHTITTQKINSLFFPKGFALYNQPEEI